MTVTFEASNGKSLNRLASRVATNVAVSVTEALVVTVEGRYSTELMVLLPSVSRVEEIFQ